MQMAPIAVRIGNANAIEIETGIEDIMGEDTMTATVTVIATAIEGDTIPTIEMAIPVDGGHRMILVDHAQLQVEETPQGKFDIATLLYGRRCPLPRLFNCATSLA